MKVVFGKSGTLPPIYFPVCSPISVACCLVKHLPFFDTSRTSVAHFLKPVSTHCSQIHTALSKFSKRQPGLESLHTISNCRLPVKGSNSQLFQMVLSRDNGPMLLLHKPSQPYFLPLVECTKVGLPNPLGKWLQAEFRVLQADCSFPFRPAQVQQIIAFLICIKFVLRNLW